MKFAYPTVSLLACYFAFGIADLLDNDSDLDSASNLGMGGSIDPGPQPPPKVILEPEKDGVKHDGSTTYYGDPGSCWTKPLEPPILGQYPIANGGTCRICVVQNGTGEWPYNAPFYEIWVRDDKNHAIGGIDPFTMQPGSGAPDEISYPPSPVKFSVGAKLLNMWSSLSAKNVKYVTVYMVWGKPAGWVGPETMRYDTNTSTTGPSTANNNCTMQNFDDSGMRWFQCQFNC